MKIGVFDSGIGGLSVARAIERKRPDLDVIFVNDSKHVPYGTRTPEEIYGFAVPIFKDLIAQGCSVIVVACNTVSTTLRMRLREDFSIPFVLLEPMVKPAAAMTKTGTITVCATPATLHSERYHWLKDTYASGVRVLEPDCADWSYLIEHNRMNTDKIREDIEPALQQGTDVIVLGCTHYHWIQEEIQAVAGKRAVVIQPEDAVVRQLERILAALPATPQQHS